MLNDMYRSYVANYRASMTRAEMGTFHLNENPFAKAYNKWYEVTIANESSLTLKA